MKIGEAFDLCGLPSKTIRYYEDIGFVVPQRRESGYREFDKSQIKKLAFIRQARTLGFSVAECRVLLMLRDGRDTGHWMTETPYRPFSLESKRSSPSLR